MYHFLHGAKVTNSNLFPSFLKAKLLKKLKIMHHLLFIFLIVPMQERPFGGVGDFPLKRKKVHANSKTNTLAQD